MPRQRKQLRAAEIQPFFFGFAITSGSITAPAFVCLFQSDRQAAQAELPSSIADITVFLEESSAIASQLSRALAYSTNVLTLSKSVVCLDMFLINSWADFAENSMELLSSFAFTAAASLAKSNICFLMGWLLVQIMSYCSAIYNLVFKNARQM